jgi:serine protease Do
MMNLCRTKPLGSHNPRLVLALTLGLACLVSARADSNAPALTKLVPENVEDLRAIQTQVKKALAKAMPATVGIRIGNAAGSGVIVRKDGYVLTAGHISGKPDRDAVVILPDGRKLKGKTLGSNRGMDSGMIRITDEGEWPFVEMGDTSKLKAGQWCIGLGHPDGFKPGRKPVVRLGRVIQFNRERLLTSCILVGGDSGGPLFDLNGKVIGIHGSIGTGINQNLHVPVNTYRGTWDRLVKGEVWNDQRPAVYVGIVVDRDAKTCKIVEVAKDSPAAKAGLKADDVVISFGGRKVGDMSRLLELLSKRKPGDEVPLEVQRGEEVVKLTVKLGKPGV